MPIIYTRRHKGFPLPCCTPEPIYFNYQFCDKQEILFKKMSTTAFLTYFIIRDGMSALLCCCPVSIRKLLRHRFQAIRGGEETPRKQPGDSEANEAYEANDTAEDQPTEQPQATAADVEPNAVLPDPTTEPVDKKDSECEESEEAEEKEKPNDDVGTGERPESEDMVEEESDADDSNEPVQVEEDEPGDSKEAGDVTDVAKVAADLDPKEDQCAQTEANIKEENETGEEAQHAEPGTNILDGGTHTVGAVGVSHSSSPTGPGSASPACVVVRPKFPWEH